MVIEACIKLAMECTRTSDKRFGIYFRARVRAEHALHRKVESQIKSSDADWLTYT